MSLSACSMARGQEETSTSQAGRRRGPSWDTPSTSSLISSLPMEELRSYCQIPNNIDFEFSEDPTESTINEEDSVVYFTREKLATRIRFPISSLVKQFLYFSGAPPALIHMNVIRILTGCSVLNLLYQLYISLVEVCFIYTLKLEHESRLFMSAQSPRMQFVTGLPDSPKTEDKGVILVRGPWYETPSSSDLPFAFNQSMSFSGVFKSWDLYVSASLCLYPLRSRILLLYIFCAGKSRRGRLVNWVEKASFKKIHKLLEIFERGQHHEIPLTARNLHELSRSPSPYIIPVIPCSLPTEIVEGEHYVIVDLLNLAPSSSSPAKTFET